MIDDDGNFSEITTGTYIVGETAEKYQGYSVLSVVSDPENLFGDNGICVTGREYDEWYNNTDRSTEAPATNFYQHGKLWEREAVIQLWDEHGEITINQNCGIRVQGNASRGYSIKRLSLYAREFYSGSNYFSSSLFGDIKTHSIYLRNDNYDIVVHRLLENRNSISVQRSIPVVMFIDGEFYCQTYIREKYDEEYLAEYYNVDQNDIVIISDREADSGKEADIKLFEDFVSYVSNNDASDPEIYEQICQQMDIQSFIDFICINLYMNNIDWSLYKNFKAWRTVTTDGGGYNDGKWRWCIYDTDAVGWSGDSLGIRREEINPFSVKLPYTHHGDHKLTYSEAPIYSSLIKNPDFKRRFVLTYFDLMNTCFSEEYSQPIIDELGLTDNPIWKTFLTERSEYAINNIVNELELCGKTGQLTVSTNNTSGGTVKVNTVTVNFSENSWHGIYATDYPLIITAEPADGWEFAGWEGSLESNSFSLTVDLTEAGIDLKAVFVKTGGEN